MDKTVKDMVKTGISVVSSFGSGALAGGLVAAIIPPQFGIPLRICSYVTAGIASWMFDDQADEFIDKKLDEVDEAVGAVVEAAKQNVAEKKAEVAE